MRVYIAMVMAVLLIGSSVSAGEKLTDALTALGAEKAGNGGAIPAWEGGLRAIPAGYVKGGYHPDPFAEDKPLFTITHDNWTQYKDKLSEGHQKMFAKYADFRMPVYPTRRSASYPDFVYRAAAKNAEAARLTNDGNGVSGGSVAIPFPVPTSGVEAIWNHLLRYRGPGLSRDVGDILVTSPTTRYTTSFHEEMIFPLSVENKTFDAPENILVYFKQQLAAPPRLAGTLILVEETLDKAKELRRSWLYNPGLRRVSRAPFISYDSIPPSSEGLRTFDQYDMYNGAIDRYDWTLDGKMEMYVPYNAYRFSTHKPDVNQIAGPYFLKPENTRYELHRVWKVTANLKKGKNHIYAKRVFYIDEDSWQILVSLEYDGRGDLWRLSEGHVINFYEVPLVMPSPEVHYDLKSGQYIVRQLQFKPFDYSPTLTPEDFSPSSLRREGNR